jgi:ADP-ribose pyrophosphatase
MANRTSPGREGKKPANKKAAQQKGSRTSRRPAESSLGIELVSSTLSYDGPLFQVYTDKIIENGKTLLRDVVRHRGSAVILAIDDPVKKDPLVVVERQYRHAAAQYLLEVPAGTLGEGEDMLEGAKRELLEETGFTAKRWSRLVRYFASPGFLGEWMQIFLAEGLMAGAAKPEDDETIEVQMVPLSELLRMCEKDQIHDGKTLISLMLYDRLRRITNKSGTKKK